jgi:UDP-N-acetylmuramoyl-tripeptide--D-alanyl-D-alanine ligase
MTKRIKEPVFYNNPGDFYACQLISADPYVLLKTEKNHKVQSNMIGSYNFKNIAAALCIGKYFAVTEDAANSTITHYLPENNRSQIIKTKANTIILDAYNANPVSMKAALDNIEAMEHPNKVVILGDMFELGDDTDDEHERIIEQVNSMSLNLAFFCGEASSRAANKTNLTSTFIKRKHLEEYLEENPLKGSLILIKASRGMGLETLVDYL